MQAHATSPGAAIAADACACTPGYKAQGDACLLCSVRFTEREFFIDNLLVRIYFIIVMIRWTGLAQWDFDFPFPGSLTSTFLIAGANQGT